MLHSIRGYKSQNKEGPALTKYSLANATRMINTLMIIKFQPYAEQ